MIVSMPMDMLTDVKHTQLFGKKNSKKKKSQKQTLLKSIFKRENVPSMQWCIY